MAFKKGQQAAEAEARKAIIAEIRGMNFYTEDLMKRWDSWVRYYRGDGGGSWPRDAFESLIDWIPEEIADRLKGAEVIT